jgi:hypothetical protein
MNVLGRGGSAPLILDLGCVIRGERTTGTYRIGGCLGPITTGLRVLENG